MDQNNAKATGSTTKKAKRPVYLNLFKIWLPIGGIVSIAHRASGILLVLALPFWISNLQLSLAGDEGFAAAKTFFSSMHGRVGMLIFIALFAHHFFAGLRHLFMDLDIGVKLEAARRSAWAVLIADAVVIIYCAARFFA